MNTRRGINTYTLTTNTNTGYATTTDCQGNKALLSRHFTLPSYDETRHPIKTSLSTLLTFLHTFNLTTNTNTGCASTTDCQAALVKIVPTTATPTATTTTPTVYASACQPLISTTTGLAIPGYYVKVSGDQPPDKILHLSLPFVLLSSLSLHHSISPLLHIPSSNRWHTSSHFNIIISGYYSSIKNVIGSTSQIPTNPAIAAYQSTEYPTSSCTATQGNFTIRPCT